MIIIHWSKSPVIELEFGSYTSNLGIESKFEAKKEDDGTYSLTFLVPKLLTQVFPNLPNMPPLYFDSMEAAKTEAEIFLLFHEEKMRGL